MSNIILGELHGWHKATASERVVRIATEAFQDQADPTPWWPVLRSTGGWTLAATAPGETDGATKADVGELVLDERPPKADRFGISKLTELLDGLNVVGWPLHLYALDRDECDITRRVPLAVLTIGELERRTYSRVLRPRDRTADFDTIRAAGPGVYAGTGGAEGPPALASVGKELLIGRHRHLEPTYLGMDPANGCHLYSVSQGLPMGGYTEVRSRGRVWPEVAGVPASGRWMQDAARGLLWVGPGDVGTITCAAGGVVDQAGTVIETAGAAAAWLARHSGALTAAEIDAAALVAGVNRPVCLWLRAGDATSLRSAMDDLTRSVRVHWYLNPMGALTFARGGRPTDEPPSATLRAGVDFVTTVTEDRVSGIPPRTVRVRYARNDKVLSANDMVTEVSPEDRAALMAEWLEEVSPDDPALVAACPIPREEPVDTRLSTSAAAAAEAVERRNDGWDPPARHKLPLKRLPTEHIGQIVTVIDAEHPDVGAAGRLGRIAEVKVDLSGEDNAVWVILGGAA